jgi:hypothetical protein
MSKLTNKTRTLLLIALLASTPAWSASVITFTFETDTSSLAGESGYIDLQFNALSGAQSATAAITNFTTTGTLEPGAITYAGDASGNLAGAVTIANGASNNSGYNDYNEALKFGSLTEFTITLSGLALSASNGSPSSTFALSFYASDDATPLLSTDLSGASVAITINPNGSATVATFPNAVGVDDTQLVSSVPEPPPHLMLVIGAIFVIALWGRPPGLRLTSRSALVSAPNPVTAQENLFFAPISNPHIDLPIL